MADHIARWRSRYNSLNRLAPTCRTKGPELKLRCQCLSLTKKYLYVLQPNSQRLWDNKNWRITLVDPDSGVGWVGARLR